MEHVELSLYQSMLSSESSAQVLRPQFNWVSPALSAQTNALLQLCCDAQRQPLLLHPPHMDVVQVPQWLSHAACALAARFVPDGE